MRLFNKALLASACSAAFFLGETGGNPIAFANCITDGGLCKVSDGSTQTPSNLTFSPSDIGRNNAALVVTNASTIEGSNLTISTPLQNGFYAGFVGADSTLYMTDSSITASWHGLYMDGPGSTIVMQNGSITAENTALFLKGNHLGDATIHLTNVDLSSTGNAVAVRIDSNGNNSFNMDGGSVTGLTLGAILATGNNQTIKLNGVTINSAGSYGVSHGSSGATGNQLDIIGGTIIHQSTNGNGALHFLGGDVLIDGTVVKNTGLGSAVMLGPSGGTSRLRAQNGFEFEAFGSDVYGININNTGQAFLYDGKITTHGNQGRGIMAFANANPQPLHAERVQVETHGVNGHGIEIRGGSSTLIDVDIKVNNPAVGLMAFGNQINLDMTGGSVEAAGSGIAVASVVQNNQLPVNHLKFTGTKIVASGVNAVAVHADRGSHMEFDGADITSLNNTSGGTGVRVQSGSTVDIKNDSSVTTDGAFAPALVFLGATATNSITVENSTITAQDSFAVLANGGTDKLDVIASIIEGDRLILAGNCQIATCGQLFGSKVTFTADNNQLFGHALVSDISTLTMNMNEDSIWTIRPSSGNVVTSGISFLNMDHAHITFDQNSTNFYQTLQVGRGNLDGKTAVYNATNGASISLNTLLNAGGALSNQFTDRLLIEGDVSGTTLVNIAVAPGSTGSLTGNGAADGISLIQVLSSMIYIALLPGYRMLIKGWFLARAMIFGISACKMC